MKNTYLLFLIFISFSIQCQSSKEISSNDWKDFLAKFPSKSIEALNLIPSVDNVKDTISRVSINNLIWSNYKKPEIIYSKISNFKYPVGGEIFIDKNSFFNGFDKSGNDCSYNLKSYPYFKINLKNKNILLSYLDFEIGEDLIKQSLLILNDKNSLIGYFAFIYSHSWDYCDSTLEEILKDPKPLSAPIEIIDNGFILHDQMVGSYYEDTLNDQYWTVIIKDDGKFEIVKEVKNYEGNVVKLWSKKGYYIDDPDGYVNLRKEKSSSSKIVKKIDTGTPLEILNASGDWWEVKIGNEDGFIHKSRIKEGN